MSDNVIEDGIFGESILTCAARVAQTIENSEGFSEITSLIALRCAGLSLLSAAAELAQSIEDPYVREQTLSEIAASCVGYEEDDLAAELVEGIEDPGLRGVALEQMAVKYAEAGEFDHALEMVGDMDDGSQALGKIALVYSDDGHFDNALEIARRIDDPGLRAAALIELAARNNQSGGDPEVSGELLPEVLESAEEIEFPQERVNTLLDLASLHKEMGQAERAYEIVSQALKLCDELDGERQAGIAKDDAKDKALAGIAARFAQLQRYDEAIRVIEMIDSPFQFAAAQADVALEYDRVGQREQALTLLADALEVARDEEIYGENTLSQRESVLSAIATSYATVGHAEEALQVASQVSDSNLRYGTLREVARTCARSGKQDCISRVTELLEGALAKVFCSISVSDAFAEAGQPELAERTLFQALEKAETIELTYEKALALMEVGARLGRRGHEAKASDLLFGSLEVIALIKGNYQKARALFVLDEKYRQVEERPGEREERILQAIAP